MTDRYDYDKLPISQETKKGMSLNVNDLGAIGRMLSLQDNVYDEKFDDLLKLVKNVLEGVSDVKREIDDLKKEVGSLRKELEKVSATVDKTRKEVDCLTKDVEKLKRANSPLNILIRIAASIGVGLAAVRLMHGPM